MMDLFAQSTVGDAIKTVTDPLTNIGALGLLTYFLTRTVPSIVDKILVASAAKDDKMTKALDTIQARQDVRETSLIASIERQTTALKDSFRESFGSIKEGLLSVCKGSK